MAEVFSNQQQELSRCIEFIKIASYRGCESVKFQSFNYYKFSASAVIDNSQTYKATRNWQLPDDFIISHFEASKKYNIEFASTPLDLEALEKLNKYIDFPKIFSFS